MYSKKELLDGLATSILGRKIFVFEKIDSTNVCAKVLADVDMEEGTVVIAEYQTSGHGRLGRSWLSEAGKNLLFSIIIRPAVEQKRAGLLTFFAAAGTALGIESVLGCRIECKWPNDLLLHEKKCCGILLESSSTSRRLDYAVIGIGLNVNQAKFEPGLKRTATSLRLESGKTIDRKKLFQHILQNLDGLYSKVKEGDFNRVKQEWLSRTSMIGKVVTVEHEKFATRGIVHSINDDGGVVLKTSTGLQTFFAGDVTLRQLKKAKP